MVRHKNKYLISPTMHNAKSSLHYKNSPAQHVTCQQITRDISFQQPWNPIFLAKQISATRVGSQRTEEGKTEYALPYCDKEDPYTK